jgi:hypothetical protein
MPTDTEISCFIIGAILAFYGFVDGIFDFFDWRRDNKLLLTGTETTGKITDAGISMGVGPSSKYHRE